MSPSPPSAAAVGGDPLDRLFRLLAETRPDADSQLIKNAYRVAAHWHQGQKRKSGDPYITHPVAVAEILAEIGADDHTLCAALLHDVVADTPYTLTDLRSDFGAEIADLVAGTMALDVAVAQPPVVGAGDAVAAAMAGDDRILMIKLADRLHNMRTLRYLPEAKQVQRSRHTLEVLVPLARTLPADTIKSELSDLASATLRRYEQPPGTASGLVLAATAVLLPASARARWREEWLGELHMLPTRRARVAFAAQVVLGIARLAATLYRPALSRMRVYRAVVAAAATVGELIMGGWRTVAALIAAVLAVLLTLMWVLHSDSRASRLARLIRALRDTPTRRD